MRHGLLGMAYLLIAFGVICALLIAPGTVSITDPASPRPQPSGFEPDEASPSPKRVRALAAEFLEPMVFWPMTIGASLWVLALLTPRERHWRRAHWRNRWEHDEK